MITLIDGDVLLYKCCYATEYNTYVVPEYGTFRHKRAIKDFLNNNFDIGSEELDEKYISKVLVTEPLQYTCTAIETLLQSIKTKTDAQQMVLYIAGVTVPLFRRKIPYPVLYKGERSPKPSNFRDARSFILNQLKFPGLRVEVVDEIEVDDALGITQCNALGDTTIIASIDKDLLTIPGLHYNLNSQEITKISDFEADRNFWIQMLMGDKVDSILGIEGIGPIRAKRLLSECSCSDEMRKIVTERYKDYFGKSWEAMFNSNSMLLHILRKPL